MVYVPEYFPGKIIVKFYDSIPQNFEEEFGKKLGYVYDADLSDSLSVFTVPIGEEKKAIDLFSKYSEHFVDWASLYDKKLVYRQNAISELEGLVIDLYDATESDDKFNSDLNNIIDYITNLKKK
ncbi:MAG: hypothetical protein ACP5N1_04960 [Candidatus Woesearchaeota archaeon]